MHESFNEGVASSKIVGIGASAGSLDALRRFFSTIRNDTNLVYVVLESFSPKFKNYAEKFLSKYTDMTIVRVSDKAVIEPNTVYVVSMDNKVIMNNNFSMEVSEFVDEKTARFPIDILFSSLAEHFNQDATGIIFSGTGSDGSIGTKRILDKGGLVFVQDRETIVFDCMPKSVIETDKINSVLNPEEIAGVINDYISAGKKIPEFEPNAKKFIEKGEFSKIIGFLYEKFSIDFNRYKMTTVCRRIFRRMRFKSIRSIKEYMNLLKNSDEEAEALYKDLLIGVTCFFRDRKVFDELQKKIIPGILNRISPKELRIWVPACSTGEEAYSIAMIIDDYLTKHDDMNIGYKIFATDINRTLIYKASTGIFGIENMEQMDEYFQSKYFTRMENGTFRINKNIRNKIVFAHQNILNDPPFIKIDLISCRNLLIYLNNDTKRKLLNDLHFALNPDGYLLLGSSETLEENLDTFKIVDSGMKLYSKVDKRLPLERYLNIYPTKIFSKSRLNNNFNELRASEEFQYLKIYSSLLEAYMPPGILINEGMEGLYFFGDVQKYLMPLSGRATLDILKMMPENLRMIVSSAVQKTVKTGKKVSYKRIGYEIDSKNYLIEIQVEPLKIKGYSDKLYFIRIMETIPTVNDEEGVMVDIGRESRGKLNFLESELQYTKEVLQTTVEELETSNEELQASNEELLASNEELQSSNEELNSVNEELYTVNCEHEKRIKELTKTTNDLNNLMESTDISVIFLDNEIRIRKFTDKAAELFNLIDADLGGSVGCITTSFIGNFDITAVCKKVLSTKKSMSDELTLTNGKNYVLKIIPYTDERESIDGITVTFIDVTDRKNIENNLFEQRKNFSDFFCNLSEGMAICKILKNKAGNSVDIRFLDVNPSFERFMGKKRNEIVGELASDLLPTMKEKWLERLEKISTTAGDTEYEESTEALGNKKRWFKIRVFSNRQDQFVLSLKEITEEVNERKRLTDISNFYEEIFDDVPFGIFRCDVKGNILFANKYMLQKTGCKSIIDFDIGIFNFIHENNVQKLKTLLSKFPLINVKTSYVKDGEEHFGKVNLVRKMVNGESVIDCSFIENTEMTKMFDHNQYLAEHDELTGLFNRRYMENVLYRKRLTYPLGLILVDMNTLKLTNDAFGHGEGDKAIKKVADSLRIQFANHAVGRMGGDEFLVIAQKTDEIEMNMKMERVLNDLKINRGKFPVSISYGISFQNKKNLLIDDIYRDAENKMYESKFSMKAYGRGEILEYLREIFNSSTHETYEHCEFAQKIAMKIANKLNLGRADDLDRLKAMAFFHDIGKITVPENILNKKGKLTSEECEILKNHTINGYRIASSVPALYSISSGILNHHERWDGKGYKNGIESRNLSILIRIVTLADAYSAMRSDRPYRRALSKKKAVEEVKKANGKQFDPNVVKAFLNCVDEIDNCKCQSI